MNLHDLVRGFLQDLESFDYQVSSIDHIWHVLFPDERENWHHIHIQKYRQIFFVFDIDGKAEMLEVDPDQGVRAIPVKESGCATRHPSQKELEEVWLRLLPAAWKWLKVVKSDWIKANQRVNREYPLDKRYGIVPHSVARASIKELYRLNEAIGIEKTQKLLELIENGFFTHHAQVERETMTAADYFKYCRIAYIAGQCEDEVVDESQSGRELYRHFADGRDDGLLAIDPDSEQEFAAWLDRKHPKRLIGGHPWEIKRGGNFTHITLMVRRPAGSTQRFVVELAGQSMSRMAEMLKMLLALVEAGLPISIADPESVRKRLLAQDNLGIIPRHIGLYRAWQHFPKHQDVFDVIHYQSFGRYKRRATPFITWEPLPILKPKTI